MGRCSRLMLIKEHSMDPMAKKDQVHWSLDLKMPHQLVLYLRNKFLKSSGCKMASLSKHNKLHLHLEEPIRLWMESSPQVLDKELWLQTKWMPIPKCSTLLHLEATCLDPCHQLEMKFQVRKSSLRSIPRSSSSLVPSVFMLASKERIGMYHYKILSKSCLPHLSNSWEKMLRVEKIWDH